MNKHLLTSAWALITFTYLAQNNVGIGTPTPNSQAILEIESDTKGILIPRITTIARNALGTGLTGVEDGMLVYDKDLTTFFYWDGPNLQWTQVGSGTNDNWGSQVVQTAGTNISGNGTFANPLIITDNDSDPNNEIELPSGGANGQILSTDGNGNYTWINDASGTDNQNITGSSLSGVNLTIGIENGTNQTIDLSGLQDGTGTDDQNISGSGLSGSTLTIGIEGGNSETVNLSSLRDNLGNHTASQNIDLTTNKLVGNGGTSGILIQNDGHTRVENLPDYNPNTDTLIVISDAQGNLHRVSIETFANALGIGITPPPTFPSGTIHCDGTPTAVIDVLNPTTGKTWMDRNLGASQVATNSTDAQAYGDLYQWGRPADGHQCRNSGTTGLNSSSNTPNHNNFILGSTWLYDWRSPQNNNLWQGVNGTNNPCPSGYRIPTETELNAERLSWTGGNNRNGAYGSPLKFPVAGSRDYVSGVLSSVGSFGRHWSSTVSGTRARYLSFNSGGALMSIYGRANGLSVRCIKD